MTTVVHLSLKQILLYQLGYFLFHKCHDPNEDEEEVMRKAKILQQAIEEIKSWQHNNYFVECLELFDWEFDREETDVFDEIERQQYDGSADDCIPISWIHPAAFGMWVNSQTLVPLNFKGTLDDTNTITNYWRDLTGKNLSKKVKKQSVSCENIVHSVGIASVVRLPNDNDTSPSMNEWRPMDIHESETNCIRANLFRLSITRNRIFQVLIGDVNNDDSGADNNSSDHKSNNNNNDCECPFAPKKPGDESSNAQCNTKNDSCNHSLEKILQQLSGCDLTDRILNPDPFRIAASILWEPLFTHQLLSQLFTNANFNALGVHDPSQIGEMDTQGSMRLLITPAESNHLKTVFDLSRARSAGALGLQDLESSAEPMEPGSYAHLGPLSESGAQSQFPRWAVRDVSGGTDDGDKSVDSSPTPRLHIMHLSVDSVGSGKSGSMMSINTDYCGTEESLSMDEEEIENILNSDDLNEWRLAVDAINSLKLYAEDAEHMADDDFEAFLIRVQSNVVKQLKVQRSGLIKTVVSFIVTLGQSRSAILNKEEHFAYWLTALLNKCAENDKVRTRPAHDAVNEVINHILNFSNTAPTIHRIMDWMHRLHSSEEKSWHKVPKAENQFALAIANLIDRLLLYSQSSTPVTEESKEVSTETQSIYDSGCAFFKQWILSKNPKIRQTSINPLLVTLYNLDKNGIAKLAESHLTKQAMNDFLTELKHRQILSPEHSALKSRKKGKSRGKGGGKGKTGGKGGRLSMKEQIRQAKLKAQQRSESEPIDDKTEEKDASEDATISILEQKRDSITP